MLHLEQGRVGYGQDRWGLRWWCGADGPYVGYRLRRDGGDAEGEVLSYRGDKEGIKDLAYAGRFGAERVADVVGDGIL